MVHEQWVCEVRLPRAGLGILPQNFFAKLVNGDRTAVLLAFQHPRTPILALNIFLVVYTAVDFGLCKLSVHAWGIYYESELVGRRDAAALFPIIRDNRF